MKNLTVEEIIEKRMTPVDMVKYFRPEWSDGDCKFFLWEFTCYPFFSLKIVVEHLNKKLGGK